MSSHPVLEELHRTGSVRDAAGNERPVRDNVSTVEAEYLVGIIASDPTITETLEIGCAYGVSALHICDALRGRTTAHHTIVDPNQMSQWEGIGVAQLQRADIDFFELIAEPSELALPDLLRRKPSAFDLIFIDGWHSFDHVMLDLYYSNRLVRNNGCIVLDDCDSASVSMAVSYFLTYPAYEILSEPTLVEGTNWRQRTKQIVRSTLPPAVARWLLPEAIYDDLYARVRHPSMVALRKVAEDNRHWDYFHGF